MPPTTTISSGFLAEFLRLQRQQAALTGRQPDPNLVRAAQEAELGARSEAAQRQTTIDRGLRLQEEQAKAQSRAATASGAIGLGSTAATLGLLYKGGYFSKPPVPVGVTQEQAGQAIVKAASSGYQAGAGAGAGTTTGLGVTAPAAASAIPASIAAPTAATAYTGAGTGAVSYGLFSGEMGASTIPAGIVAPTATTMSTTGAGALPAATPVAAYAAPVAIGLGLGYGVSKLAAGIKNDTARRLVGKGGGALSGALAGGALAGTAIMPGIGTAVGAIVGGIAGWVGGEMGDK